LFAHVKPIPAISISGLVCLVAFSLCLACSPASPLSPAAFEVVSLKVTPQDAHEGQEITVTAQVRNLGGVSGNFDEPLLINGLQADSKVITMQPGSTRTISYTLVIKKPGAYSVTLYNTSTKFNVKAIVEREVELKYDTGNARTVLWAGNNGGFLISFTPSNPPFRINKIRICGGLYGVSWEGKTFELYILDSDMKSVVYDQIYSVAKFPVRGAFPYQPPLWVDFDITPVTLDGKFFIYLYTSTTEHKGIHVGVDDTVFNDHSDLAQGKPPYITVISPGYLYPPTIWYADSTKDNWMIRAVGTSLVPQ
jgi:hypothetical protein